MKAGIDYKGTGAEAVYVRILDKNGIEEYAWGVFYFREKDHAYCE